MKNGLLHITFTQYHRCGDDRFRREWQVQTISRLAKDGRNSSPVSSRKLYELKISGSKDGEKILEKGWDHFLILELEGGGALNKVERAPFLKMVWGVTKLKPGR